MKWLRICVLPIYFIVLLLLLIHDFLFNLLRACVRFTFDGSFAIIMFSHKCYKHIMLHDALGSPLSVAVNRTITNTNKYVQYAYSNNKFCSEQRRIANRIFISTFTARDKITVYVFKFIINKFEIELYVSYMQLS